MSERAEVAERNITSVVPIIFGGGAIVEIFNQVTDQPLWAHLLAVGVAAAGAAFGVKEVVGGTRDILRERKRQELELTQTVFSEAARSSEIRLGH